MSAQKDWLEMVNSVRTISSAVSFQYFKHRYFKLYQDQSQYSSCPFSWTSVSINAFKMVERKVNFTAHLCAIISNQTTCRTWRM